MTQTIEQLTARVRELEEENARLKTECDDIKQVQFPRKLKAVAVGWKKKLAAEQLNNKLLRDALEFLNARIVTMDLGGVVERALSLHASTEVLDKYVAEKVKEAGKFDVWKTNPYTKVLETSIEQLTKQRDLAVEALEKWDMFFSSDAETAVLTIAEDPSTLTGCQKATKESLSAIKESEAMAQGEKGV